MSSDTFAYVYKRDGRYWVAIGFASDEGFPQGGESYATLEQALREANEQYTEYGITLDPSAYEVEEAKP